jgi:peptidoglycan/LPS O-acetylase OafA/YrhL
MSLRRWSSLDRIDARQFYWLRFARIAPCLLLVVLLSSVLHLAGAAGFVIPPERPSLGRAVLAVLTFHMNWLEGHHGYLPGNWDVLWSLSVEEIFYLSFPLVCLSLRRQPARDAASARWLLLPLLVLIVVGPLSRVALAGRVPWDDYAYLSCMDGIAFGCLAALLTDRRRLGLCALRSLLTLGIVVVVLSLVFRRLAPNLFLQRVGLAISALELGVTLVVIALAQGIGSALLARGTGLLRRVGRCSYEIYLTHMFVILGLMPLIVDAKPQASAIMLWYVVLLAASVALGWIVSEVYSESLNRALRSASWLAVSVVLSACACRSRAATPPADTRAPEARGPAAGPDITEYAARIAVDVASRSVSGTATLTYAASRRAAELRLPEHEIAVDAVSANGAPLPFRIEAATIIIELPGAAPSASTGQLDIAYHATPARGLVFSPDLVYTNFFTCHWLPCKEEPGDKASFRLDITVPAAFTLVASGRLVRVLPAGPGLQRFVWQEARPYSTYLYGFAAGRLTRTTLQAGHTELQFFGAMPASELEARFRPTESMLRFFEEKATIALPGRIYAQVLVPGSEAQEKSSFSLIGRQELDPILVDETEDWVIAHELAHQWWGNLITCRDWSHFWLDEGVTTFMVAAFKEQRWGAAAYARELGLLRERYQRAIDAKFDVKLAFAGEYPSLGIRRAITYSKAALFLDVLRRELGERAFWSGIGRFTRERAGQSVESRDFQHDVEAATGRDLSALFEAWVYDRPSAAQ